MTLAQFLDEAPAPALFHAPEKTFTQFLGEKWETICRGLDPTDGERAGKGLPPTGEDGERDIRNALRDLAELLRPWGDRPIGSRCPAPSFVAADGFPAELSVSWRGARPEVRVLFESLGTDPTPYGCQEAGRRLTRRLARRPGTDIARCLRVEELFLSPAPEPGRPTIWHSLARRPGEQPRYKVYFNPQAQGRDRAAEVVGEAMGRLGLAAAWAPVGRRAGELARRGHELEFFALDLTGGDSARVKVYFRHHALAIEELDTVAALARHHDPERAARARALIYGRDSGTVHNEPMTCLAFRAGAGTIGSSAGSSTGSSTGFSSRSSTGSSTGSSSGLSAGPDEANLYLRLPGNTLTDTEATARITRLMRLEGVDPRPYAGMVRRLTTGLPAGAGGLQELCSFRTTGAGVPADIGVYLRFGVYDTPGA
ncbi:tryptophan dimethylallyltransferase family protein [Streptomyces sp. NPDC004610]|uniref:tryptophan dimethylallyltransferase family protein n=1 Tax=unclassified Streptomyces TaxID=2593676 RepID=UPI0033A76CF3